MNLFYKLIEDSGWHCIQTRLTDHQWCVCLRSELLKRRVYGYGKTLDQATSNAYVAALNRTEVLRLDTARFSGCMPAEFAQVNRPYVIERVDEQWRATITSLLYGEHAGLDVSRSAAVVKVYNSLIRQFIKILTFAAAYGGKQFQLPTERTVRLDLQTDEYRL